MAPELNVVRRPLWLRLRLPGGPQTKFSLGAALTNVDYLVAPELNLVRGPLSSRLCLTGGPQTQFGFGGRSGQGGVYRVPSELNLVQVPLWSRSQFDEETQGK